MYKKRIIMEPGRAYINGHGELVEIVRRASSRFVHNRFLDKHKHIYTAGGYSCQGDSLKNLVDYAKAVFVGDTYDYHWPDGQSVGQYIVTAVDAKGYDIIWSNNAPNRVQYGTPLNYGAVRVS